MSSLAEVAGCFREGLALWELLRRAGFAADRLYFCPREDGIYVAVQSGDGYYAVLAHAAPEPFDLVAVSTEWARAGELWRSAEEAERVSLFEGSAVRLRLVPIVAELHEAGLLPTKRFN